MLKERLITAGVLLFLAFGGLFWLPNAYWSMLLGIVTVIGAFEWSRLSGWTGLGRVVFVIVVAASIAGLIVVNATQSEAGAQTAPSVAKLVWLIAIGFWVLIALPWLAQLRHWRHPALLAVAGWCVLVPMWLAASHLQRSPGLLLALMGVVWIADTAAYFAGKRFGRNKLAPNISPGKTREGAIGAFAAVFAYFFVQRVVPVEAWAPLRGWGTLAIFFALVGFSILGDLFESWMKREAGVKDSGSLLPGHGGLLDRVDGLSATLPLAALAYGVTWQ